LVFFTDTGMPTLSLSTFILLALACFPAAAENWRVVRSDDEMRIEIDAATLVRNDSEGSVRAWERATFAKPRQAIPGDFYFKSAKSLALHHCAKRTTTYLYRGYYEEDGREIKSITAATDLDNIEYLTPGSLEEHKLVFACTYKAGTIKRSKTPEPSTNTTEATSPADTKAMPPTPPAKPAATAKAPAGK
jgi:hypothetical protein